MREVYDAGLSLCIQVFVEVLEVLSGETSRLYVVQLSALLRAALPGHRRLCSIHQVVIVSSACK